MTDLSPAAPPREPVIITTSIPMTDTKPRDLIKLLIDALKKECNWIDNPKHDELIAKANIYLAQSGPVAPTDEELREMWLGKKWFNEGATYREFASICRAALARWGK